MRYAARQDGAGSESPPKKKNPAQAGGGQVTRERNSRTAGGIGGIGEPSCSP
jgi:hypothetical protein